jgi:hypothetical protein
MERKEKAMDIPLWVSVSICFILIILVLIALSTPIGIILIMGIMGIAISLAIYFMTLGGTSEGQE